jgi:hypothetical protein
MMNLAPDLTSLNYGWMGRKRLREGFLKATAPPNEVSRPSEMDERK